MEEEIYYINVREPVETRKKLLETSRQVVLALQKYEGFKLKRLKKHDFIDHLRKNFREINELILRLKKELPQIKPMKKLTLPEEKPRAPARIGKARKELTDLEKELGDIEKKLGRLR